MRKRDGSSHYRAFQARIRQLADESGSVLALAQRSGLSETAVRNYLNGGEPSRPALAALAKASQVCLEWLATGEGSRQKESSKSSFIPIPILRTPAVAGEASESSRERPHESKSGEVLPFNGQWLQEQLKCDPADVVALRVAGASMRPTLERGDLIIVNRADNVLGDGIFALKLGEALLVKTVVCRGKDTFDLVSDNPAYGNIHVDLTRDGDHLNVIGRVAAHWRTL